MNISFPAVCLFLIFTFHSPANTKYDFLSTVGKNERLSPSSINRKSFLNDSNIQRIIVIPSAFWSFSGVGPEFYINRFKRAFESAAPIKEADQKIQETINSPFTRKSIPIQKSPNVEIITWYGIYFLTVDGDFLTFGETPEGFIFRTRKTIGVIHEDKAQQDAAANP